MLGLALKLTIANLFLVDLTHLFPMNLGKLFYILLREIPPEM